MLFAPQVRVSSTGRAHPDNSRKVATLLRAQTQEQAILSTEDRQMSYVGFNYHMPALEQATLPTAPIEPDFPAVPGRLAWVDGGYKYMADTVVSYRRGRRIHTEWHALARVGADV